MKNNNKKSIKENINNELGLYCSKCEAYCNQDQIIKIKKIKKYSLFLKKNDIICKSCAKKYSE